MITHPSTHPSTHPIRDHRAPQLGISHAQARATLIHQLWNNGTIQSVAVCHAMLQIPREQFLEEDTESHLAYEDAALSIAHDQTISQPSIVASMLEALQLRPHHCVLEIGTGSGYHCALLARLCRRVFSIERVRSLAKRAEERLASLRLSNVSVHHGDGFDGWMAPQVFDRILLTAAVPSLPRRLIEQLSVGGIVVLPCGSGNNQQLMRLTKGGGGLFAETLCDVRFVPMHPGVVDS